MSSAPQLLSHNAGCVTGRERRAVQMKMEDKEEEENEEEEEEETAEVDGMRM